MMQTNYIEALTRFLPARQVRANGDGSDYDSIVALDGLPIPPQAELDALRISLSREVKWTEIKAERDRRKFNGVKIGTSWFHSDDSSRIQQIGLVMMGAGMPAGIMWKTMTDSFVLMTPTLAMQIFQATGAQDMAIFARAEQHRAAMMASPNPSAYDYSTGWPLTFGE
jgi:Domain of unknown function (DUF4376)